MNLWFLIQVIFNLITIVAIGFIFVKLNRPAKEDPRLSKGLQLLQSKISVLEDLSDRTDIQVNKLTSLLEAKIREIQGTLSMAEQKLAELEAKTEQLPIQDSGERESTKKLVKAAKLANEGKSVDEILQAVDLPRGEVEFIAKVNKDQLMFASENLPDWVNEEIADESNEEVNDLSEIFEVPRQDMDAMKKLGEAFKQACENAKVLEEQVQNPRLAQAANRLADVVSTGASKAVNAIGKVGTSVGSTLGSAGSADENTVLIKAKNKNQEPVIKKVEFPRIEVPKDFLS